MKYVALCCIALLTACDSPGPDGAATEDHSTRVVTQVTPELASVVQSNNEFTWSLYGALATTAPADNLFFAPFSVTAALSMTYAGARGDTASEMKAVLNIQGDDAPYHAALGSLFSDLNGEHSGRDYQLYPANRVYADQGFPLAADFQALLADDYQASPASEPFSIDPESARRDINGWVSTQTRGTVPELFPAASIDDQTRVVLANAVYFKASWANGFDAKKTHTATFHAASGDVPVQMMTAHGTFSALTHKDVTLVELDYPDHELSMVLVIPFDVDGLPVLESELSADFLNGLLAEAQPRDWEVDIPRFDFNTKYRLRDALTTLGMVAAFDGARADFTGISADSGLYIADVFHAAFVHADESGTAAAAATGVALPTRGAASYPIVADHPFVFVIRDKLTGAILFAGRVADPS